MKRYAMTGLAALAALVLVARAQDQQEKSQEKQSDTNAKVEVRVGSDESDERKVRVRIRTPDADVASETRGFLGVGITEVPEAIAAQLPLLDQGTGVLVERVQEGSPAAKAGLRKHDIIVSYGSKPTNSPDGLVELIQADEPGAKISLTVIRGGEKSKTEVTLGERKIEVRPRRILRPGQPRPRGRLLRPEDLDIDIDLGFGRGFPGNTVGKNRSVGVNVQTQNGQTKVEVDYQDEDGEKQQFKYEGSKQEITEAIKADEKLPEDVREDLLNSLDAGRGRGLRIRIPQFGGDEFFLDLDADLKELIRELRRHNPRIQELESDEQPAKPLKGELKSIQS